MRNQSTDETTKSLTAFDDVTGVLNSLVKQDKEGTQRNECYFNANVIGGLEAIIKETAQDSTEYIAGRIGMIKQMLEDSQCLQVETYRLLETIQREIPKQEESDLDSDKLEWLKEIGAVKMTQYGTDYRYRNGDADAYYTFDYLNVTPLIEIKAAHERMLNRGAEIKTMTSATCDKGGSHMTEKAMFGYFAKGLKESGFQDEEIVTLIEKILEEMNHMTDADAESVIDNW